MSLHYESYDDLVSKIKESLRLPPNDMLAFCEKLPDCKQVYQAFAELINESKYKQQRQSLATNFNFIVKRSLQRKDKNPQLWEVYVQEIAKRKPKEANSISQILNDWKIQKILAISFQQLVVSFQQQFTPIFQQTYFKLNFNHKLLLQLMMRNKDIGLDAKITFIQQTFKEYINLGFQQINFILQLEKADKIQQLKGRFVQYLRSLRDTLFLVNHQQNNEKLALKISLNQQLFALVKDCLFIDFFNPNVSKSNANQKIPHLFNLADSSSIQECKNSVKAMALQIFMLMLNNFSKSCSLKQFDEFKILGFMQNLVPALVQQLSETNVNKLNLSCNEQLTIAILKTMKSSVPFLFLNRYFSEQYRNIFWKIIYPLLIISDEQKRQYEDDPEGFIAQSDSINEKDEDDQQLVQSCKTYAVFLLQDIGRHIDGSLTTLTQQILAFLQNLLSGNQNEVSERILKQYKIKVSLQTCFTYLSSLTTLIGTRKQLIHKMRAIFIQNKNAVLGLKKVEKARMVIFLCYNFEGIFKDRSLSDEEEAKCMIKQIYTLVAGCLEEDQLLTKCAILFYESHYNFQQSAEIIRDRLFQLIQTTKFIDVLQTVTKVVYQAAQTLTHEGVVSLVAKLLRRIMNDNQIYMKAIKEHDNAYSNICMLKCMQTVKAITFYYANMDNTELVNEMMGHIWGIFDLMQFINVANYAEDIIKIFDIILSTMPNIQSPHFFQFLSSFGEYHAEQKQIGELFFTYLTLMKKGEQYLRDSSEGHRFLNQIVENIMLVVSYHRKHESMVAIILLQYIFINFPNVQFKHDWIYEKTEQLFSKKYEIRLSQENLSAIFNLWIIGSALSPAYDLGQIDNFSLNNLYGYHARIFAIGINMKVQQLMRQYEDDNNIVKIIYLLRKSIEFLKIFTKYNNTINSKVKEIVPQFAKVSPNQKMRETLIGIKNVNRNIYQQILRELEQDVSREQLGSMLNKRGQDNRVIFKFAT